MVPTPPIKSTMGPVVSTSSVMDTNVSSSVVLQMATLVLDPHHFQPVI